MITLPTLLFAGLVLLADELITTFQGGDSYLRAFIDDMFGDGATARIVGNIRTIIGETSKLIQDFETHAGTSSDMALGLLALIQSVGLIFTSVFGTIEAVARIVWRTLGDVSAAIEHLAVAAAKAMKFLGLYGGEVGTAKSFSTSEDYTGDIDKALGGSADRVGALIKTFSAMGNQTQAYKDQAAGGMAPPTLAEALAPPSQAEASQAMALAAFKASQGGPPSVTTTVTQKNTFNMAPGSTQAQAKEVAAAVDSVNKQSYRAAEANLVHKSEG
jgi:hypothetical protein